jgi:hypothetical protein
MNVIGSNDFTKEVFCQWFAGDQFQKGKFLFTSVELAPPECEPDELTDSETEPAKENRAIYVLYGIGILALTVFFFFHDSAAGKPVGPVVAMSCFGLVGGAWLIIWAISGK